MRPVYDQGHRANGYRAGHQDAGRDVLAAHVPAQDDTHDRNHVFIGNGQGDADMGQQPDIARVGYQCAAYGHPAEGDDDVRYEAVSEVTDEFLNNIYNIFDMIASDDFIGMRKYIESL